LLHSWLASLPRWKSPPMIRTLRLSWFRLPTDPVSPDLKGELILKIHRESLDFSNIGVKFGGWSWKSMVPKDIWFLSTSELLLAKSEKAIEFMIPTPRVPTVGANWRGLTRKMS
jgi:hypothetical protein